MNGRDDDFETLSPEPGVPGALEEETDESYSPPERPLAMNRFGTTAYEYATGEGLARRLAEEEPEADEAAPDEDDPDAPRDEDEIESRAGRATGRLAWVGDDADAPDTWARDTGLREDASSEEAAMHVIDDE